MITVHNLARIQDPSSPALSATFSARSHRAGREFGNLVLARAGNPFDDAPGP